MKTLYFHIGTPKTGTTAIQDFCLNNQMALNKCGCAFPMSGNKVQNVFVGRNAHFLMDGVKNNGLVDPRYLKPGFDAIEEGFKKYDKAIITDEGIWNIDDKRKEKLFGELTSHAKKCGYEIKVVVYMRRQDQFIESLQKQRVKSANLKGTLSVDLDGDIEGSMLVKLDYYDGLCKIRGYVGEGNVIVRIYDRSSFKGEGKNLISDFGEVCGIECLRTHISDAKSDEKNSSLTLNAYNIKKVTNTLFELEGSKNKLDSPAAKVFQNASMKCAEFKNASEKMSIFTYEERKKLVERYRESNKLVAKEFLGIDEMFTDEVEDVPVWTPNNDYMYEDIIRYFSVICLEQQQTIEKLRKRINKLEAKVDGEAAADKPKKKKGFFFKKGKKDDK